MSKVRRWALTLAAIGAAGGAGHWIGQHGLMLPESVRARAPFLGAWVQEAPAPAVAAGPSGPVIYHRDPDGKPFYSAEPTTTADGRAYVPVRASEDVRFDEPPQRVAPAPPALQKTTRRILFYRNPMGLPDTSPEPKKDWMGMSYIPVYEGEEQDSSTVAVAPGKIQRSGVRSEPAKRQAIAVPVRAPGTIQLDERRIAVIAMRSEAFVEKVENVTTGTEVKKGQPLMRVYSPAIAGVAAEYVAALAPRSDAATTWTLLQGSRQRLINLAVPAPVIAEIEQSRKVPLTFTWPAPRDGVVLERNVVEGARVMPGEALFRIADHSVVWALVDVAERDLAAVHAGQAVTVRVRSYPEREFNGRIALVYPHLNPETRTVRVRIELDNPDFALKPDMYADARINSGSDEPVLAVPESAIIDSGDRQIVIVDKGQGRFEPRPVQLGRRGAGLVEIRQGLNDREAVVTAANFLIDAESNLKAALGGFESKWPAP